MRVDCKLCLKFIENVCTVKEISIIDGKCKNEIQDNIKYYQHKYFHGILLPEITDALGESSQSYVKRFILKPRWLHQTYGVAFFEYKTYEDIPPKYIKNGSSIWQLENGNYAVLPSMSGFTIKEAKLFIDFSEKFLFLDLQGCIRQENNSDYKFYKERLK
jgi:hypothetical protein